MLGGEWSRKVNQCGSCPRKAHTVAGEADTYSTNTHNNNGGGVSRPEDNGSASSEWENLQACRRCGSCPLMPVRGLSSRGTKTGWASKGEKIMGAKTWGGQQPAESGNSQGAAVEDGRWGGGAHGQAGLCEVVWWSKHLHGR